MFSPERFPRMQTSAVVSGSWYGPLVTADATIHVKGAWVSLIASTAFDAYLAVVIIGEVSATGVDTSMLVDIGVDPAAGTTYTVEIPNILAGGAAVGGLRNVLVPVSIPKGSQVAVRNQALITADTARVGIILLGGKNRSNPWPHRGRIQDYGADTATSGGTGMAIANADIKPAWTQLGADTTRRHSGLVICAAIADDNVSSDRFLVDVGIDPAGGTTYGVVMPDVPVSMVSNETNVLAGSLGCLLAVDIPAGAAIAARAACSTSNAQGNLEIAVYAF